MKFQLTFFITIFTLLFSCSDGNNSEPVETTKPKEKRTLGERIDGPANVRDTINGKVLFSFNHNVLVECTPLKNDWHVVGTDVLLTPKQEKDFKLTAGDSIYSFNGENLGVAISDVDIWMAGETNGKFYGMIAGYTHSQNIQEESIIENQINKIIEKRGYPMLSDFDELLIDFNFYRDTISPTEFSFFVYQNVIDDPSPRDRITMQFSSDSLIEIIHSRPLKTKYPTYELIRGHKLTPIRYSDSLEISKRVEELKNGYNSID